MWGSQSCQNNWCSERKFCDGCLCRPCMRLQHLVSQDNNKLHMLFNALKLSKVCGCVILYELIIFVHWELNDVLRKESHNALLMHLLSVYSRSHEANWKRGQYQLFGNGSEMNYSHAQRHMVHILKMNNFSFLLQGLPWKTCNVISCLRNLHFENINKTSSAYFHHLRLSGLAGSMLCMYLGRLVDKHRKCVFWCDSNKDTSLKLYVINLNNNDIN